MEGKHEISQDGNWCRKQVVIILHPGRYLACPSLSLFVGSDANLSIFIFVGYLLEWNAPLSIMRILAHKFCIFILNVANAAVYIYVIK